MRDGQLPGQCIAFHHRPSPIVVSHACRHRHQNLTGRRHATGKTAAARTALSTSPSTKGTAPSATAFSIPTNAVNQPTPNRKKLAEPASIATLNQPDGRSTTRSASRPPEAQAADQEKEKPRG